MRLKNITKKAGVFLLTAALAAGIAGGCGKESSSSSSSSGSSESAKKVENVGTLNVSFPTGNIRVAVNILALKLGYFEEEGVKVNPVNLSGMNALTAINEGDGQLDILTVGFVPDLQALASGYDLKFIAGTAVEGGAVIAKKGNADKFKSDSTKIDLEAVTGAQLGFVRNESAWVVARQYLLDNGVSADKIKEIEDEKSGSIKYYEEPINTAQAVQKGEIEVGFLPMEFALLYADAYDLEIIVAAGDLQPDYVCCREVTSSKKLADSKATFVAYEKARIRAFEYYKKGETDADVKSKVVNTIADYSGKEKDYVETYLYGGVTKYATDPNTNGIVKYVEAAYNSGLLSSAAVDFSSYDIKQNIDSSAYKEALDSLLKDNPDNEVYKSLSEQYSKAN